MWGRRLRGWWRIIFFATKVTFVNEFYDIVKAFGADWYRVREGWLLDPGGKCYSYEPLLLKQVLKTNTKFRR
ncbi:MAG: hypothetical protein Q7S14_03130 [bacterium]|nr:hypothetical protein [bacterium]